MFSFRHSGEQFSSKRTLLEADALVCLATGREAQSGKLKQKGCGEEGEWGAGVGGGGISAHSTRSSFKSLTMLNTFASSPVLNHSQLQNLICTEKLHLR